MVIFFFLEEHGSKWILVVASREYFHDSKLERGTKQENVYYIVLVKLFHKAVPSSASGRMPEASSWLPGNPRHTFCIGRAS